MILKNKKALIIGIASKRSIAASIANIVTSITSGLVSSEKSNLIVTRLAGKMQPTRQTSIFLPAQENQP